jgi:hypothetical protein
VPTLFEGEHGITTPSLGLVGAIFAEVVERNINPVGSSIDPHASCEERLLIELPVKERSLLERLLVDTCVWLDIALDPRLAPLLEVLDRLCLRGTVQLVAPDVIVGELDRNAESVQQKTKKFYEALARDALDMGQVLATDIDRDDLRRTLGNVLNAMPTFQGALNSRLRRVRAMLTRVGVLAQTSTDSMMLKAFRRGLAKQAPFTRGRNSCGDSLILEHFDSCARTLDLDDRCVFVTSNKQDFGSPQDHRRPHPDIADLFEGPQRVFSINLAEYLKGIDTAAVSPAVIEAAREAAERSSLTCPAGGEHDFDPNRGANLRSRYGGLTWHLFCRKCGAKFDTGDSSD